MSVLITTREREILDLMASGETGAKFIAQSLGTSPYTVKAQLRTLYLKLGVKTKIDALRVAGYLKKRSEK